MFKKFCLSAAAALVFASCLTSALPAQADANADQTGSAACIAQNTDYKYRTLIPFAANAPALKNVVKVRFVTGAGNLEMEIYPEAAPNAAKRFIDLVKIGYYNGTPIFRVVKTPQPFVAQFGINWRNGMAALKERNFNDDPSLFHFDRGTLSFAKTGQPNSASTQVFINYGNNDFLRQQNFSVFGKITKGMEIADNFKAVGNPSMGLDQYQLWTNGENYLNSLPANQKPTMIIKAEIIKD